LNFEVNKYNPQVIFCIAKAILSLYVFFNNIQNIVHRKAVLSALASSKYRLRLTELSSWFSHSRAYFNNPHST